MVSGLLQWAFNTVETWCGRICLLLNPDRTELIVFTRKRKLPGFFEPLFFFWSYCATFYVGQVSRGSPGFSAVLDGACEYQGEEDS